MMESQQQFNPLTNMDEICYDNANWPSTPVSNKILTCKDLNGGWPSSRKSKYRDNSIVLPSMIKIDTMTYIFSLEPKGVNVSGFDKFKMADGHHIEQVVKVI